MKKHLPLLLALLALPVVTASAAVVSYTDGSQVNVLNAYNATMALSGTDAGSIITADHARFFNDNGAAMAIVRTTTSNPAATMDLGAVRNVKTITVENYINYGFTAAMVETSSDGTNWTTYTGGVTVTNTTTGASSAYNVATLNTSVNARYVRLTPTTFQNGASGSDNRWYFYTMRAFGSSGTLAGDSNLSIIANGAFSQAQSLSQIGSIGEINSAALMAPATNPHPERTVLWQIGNGEGFQLDLGQTFTVDKGTMEVDQLTASVSNPIVMTLSGSTDGTNFTTLTTYTWTADTNPGWIDLNFTAGNARYLNVVFSSSVDTDMRVSDFAFFQAPVPEPQTWALAALGVSAVLFRLRRKVRGA